MKACPFTVIASPLRRRYLDLWKRWRRRTNTSIVEPHVMRPTTTPRLTPASVMTGRPRMAANGWRSALLVRLCMRRAWLRIRERMVNVLENSAARLNCPRVDLLHGSEAVALTTDGDDHPRLSGVGLELGAQSLDEGAKVGAVAGIGRSPHV